MGEDGADLILAIEDAFQIHIADEEVSDVCTVGELHNLVISKLKGNDSKRCLTSAAFYRTRRGIVDALGIERHEIRPVTPLEELLPRSIRRQKWQGIQAAMELKLPDLRHSGWTVLALLAVGVTFALAPAVRGKVGYIWIAPLLFVGLVIGGLILRFLPFLAVVFPNHDTTVGDLARDVLAINHARLAHEVGGWNEKEAWEGLCRVIVIQTGVAREKITPEASIVDDLRID